MNNSEKDTQWPLQWLNELSEGEQRRYREDNLYPEDVEMTPEAYTEFAEKREELIRRTLIDQYVSSSEEE